MKVAQSCPTLCDSMDYIVHGILQTRILEWVAFPFSRGSSQPRDRTQVSCIEGGFFYQLSHKGSPRILQWVAYPFSSGSSRPRNWTRVSCSAGGFCTSWAIREAHKPCKVMPKKTNNLPISHSVIFTELFSFLFCISPPHLPSPTTLTLRWIPKLYQEYKSHNLNHYLMAKEYLSMTNH